MTPKPYLSFSQMSVFERSPNEYADRYLFGEKQRISRNMALGSELADSLETGEATGNPLLDLMASRLPKYELMDIPLEADLPDKKYGVIHLLAKPDSAKADYSAFYEYKTSTRKWTQKMVDESGQISFYATAIWLKTKKIPHIKLICVETAYDEQGKVCATGEMWTIPTKRTLADIIKMTARIRRAWRGIEALCEEKLL